MTALEPDHRRSIEDTIGRRLADAELVRVPGLDALPEVEIAVARELAKRQLVLCTLYLRALTNASFDATQRFITDLLASLPTR